MTDIISDQIYAFIEQELFSFFELGSYYRKTRGNDSEEGKALKSFARNVEDIDSIKDAVYNRVLILEPSSKSIFVKKFVDILSEYSEDDITGSVGLEILRRIGIKPEFNKPLQSLGYGLLNDSSKLDYFNLENLDFNFEKEQQELAAPYIVRLNKFKDFLLDYSSTFDRTDIAIDDKIISNKVFIVHGHNDGVKYEVSQTLSKLGLTPIILHEQKSDNKTIIEKIEANSDVKFAIVLLTDDDLGKAKKEQDLKARPRQNVVFEMGYFIGLLGRENVCCIINDTSLEKPNDISGIVYIDFNSNWIVSLAKELKGKGMKLNMDSLIE